MGRFFLLVVALVLLVVVGAGLFFGAFPPSPRVEQVQRTIPNDKFPTSR